MISWLPPTHGGRSPLSEWISRLPCNLVWSRMIHHTTLTWFYDMVNWVLAVLVVLIIPGLHDGSLTLGIGISINGKAFINKPTAITHTDLSFNLALYSQPGINASSKWVATKPLEESWRISRVKNKVILSLDFACGTIGINWRSQNVTCNLWKITFQGCWMLQREKKYSPEAWKGQKDWMLIYQFCQEA